MRIGWELTEKSSREIIHHGYVYPTIVRFTLTVVNDFRMVNNISVNSQPIVKKFYKNYFPFTSRPLWKK